MKVIASKRILELLKDEERSRLLLRQLSNNDKLDGKIICTSFGKFKKLT